ncbi:MAG: hypothetical protein IIC03_06720 [Proteobacteria bacterium]|nr:hypothetical protein [Pseudomonadota bacterium]
MTDKAPFDLDAALAALAIDERAARPAVSESLQARVLGDAAGIAAERAGAMVAPARVPARSGGFRLFGLFDAWSGAAVAAVALCLAIGLGVGYRAGPEVMAQAGLGVATIAVAAEERGGLFVSEDVL